MRTDSKVQVKAEEVTSSGGVGLDLSAESKETMKVTRKSLHPLQIAAGDKENLVGAGRMVPAAGEKDQKTSLLTSKLANVSSPPKKEKKKSKQEKKTITEEDLTSEEGPSEHYWEVLAETRRKALEDALMENQQLNERLERLSEENLKYKDLLRQAQDIIDTLSEAINELDDQESGGEEVIIRQA